MTLSQRELEVFSLLKQRYSLQQIAIRLNVAKETVQMDKKRLERKYAKWEF